MKKMRKLISLIMALAFIFSMAVPAMAAEPTAQEVAGNRLLSLSVIDGYPGGGLGLDKTITRAEVAVVLAKISGMGSAADLLKDTPSKFSDVQANQWYTGWINLASAQGWVKGDPQGTFRPNDPVQYREMVTMLLKALGYNDNLPGEWPTNYLAKAASLSITKGIVTDAKAAAVRGDVFIMTSRTLDKDTVSYDKDNDKFVSSGKSLLEDKMEFAKVSGFVTDIPRVSSLKSNQIRIDGKVYKVVGDVDYEEIFGAEVNAWLNDDDEVVFVDVTSDAVYYDALEDVTDEELTLSDADVDYDFAKNVKVFINGESAKASDLAASYDYAKVVLDEDGDVAFIMAYDWDNFIVVEKVDGNDLYGYGEELDIEDYTIVKDGVTIKAADLKAGDILFFNESGDGFAEVFVNKAKEGDVSRILEDRMDVAGSSYKYFNADFGTAGIWAKYLDADDEIASFTNTNKEDVAEQFKDGGKATVYVDRFGNAVYFVGDLGASKTTSFYAFVIENSVKFLDRGTAKWSLDVLTEKGVKASYDVKAADADTILGQAWTSGGTSVGDVSDKIAKEAVLKVTLDNKGEVDKVDLLTAEHQAETVEVGDKFVTTGLTTSKLTSGAIVFLIEDYTDDADDIVISTYGKLDFDKITTGDFYANGNPDVKVIVVNTSSRTPDTTDYLAIVTGSSVKLSGEKTWRVKLAVEGMAEATYYTEEDKDVFGNAKEDGGATPLTSLATGTFIKVTLTDDDKVITAIDVLAAVGNFDTQTVKSKDIQNKRITLADDTEYRLESDAKLFNSDYEAINFGDIKVGDEVTMYLANPGTVYVQFVVKGAAVVSSNAKAEIAANYMLTDPADAVNVKLTLATNVTPADVVGNYKLLVYKGAEYKGAFAITTDVVTTPAGQDFAANADLGLEDDSSYTVKVVKVTDGTVLAEKSFVTGDVTP